MEPREFTGSVRKTASRHDMDLSRPLVLVSGGPDSVALLRAILDLGGSPAVLHVNYGLRAEESDADEEFVRRLCEDLGVPCEVRRVHISGSNFQERARDERYRLAGELSESLQSSSVALGHNSGDVAETVLMNLARGAGLRGLSGIPPKRGNVVRPLLERSREEVVAYLEALGQAYRTDSTNLAGKYARNRVRLEVLPALEELHPGASQNIARGAGLLREDLAALEALSSEAVEERSGEVVLDLDGIAHPALLRHAVRVAYERAFPGSRTLDSGLVDLVVEAAEKPEGTRTLDLPGGIVAAVRFGAEVSFYKKSAGDAECRDEEKELAPGETEFAGWKVFVLQGAGFDARDAARKEVAYLDGGLGPYRVRMAREGDSMRPLGLGGKKKIFRAMMDRKVPSDLRRRTPVVVGQGGEVAWVFLGEIGAEFAVGKKTKQTIRVEVRKP